MKPGGFGLDLEHIILTKNESWSLFKITFCCADPFGSIKRWHGRTWFENGKLIRKVCFFFFPGFASTPPFTETCQELRTLQESISQQKAERQAETSTMQLSLNEVSLRLEQLQQAGRGFEGFWPGHGRWVVGKHTVTSCWFGKWNLESGKVLELKKQKNINEWLSCNKSGTSEEHLESRLSLIPNLSKLSPSS